MRVFCDTNVVAEVIEMRPQAVAMGHILSTVSDELELILSEGGFYTLTYLTERFLKRQSIFNPERVEEQRKILLRVLNTFEISSARWQGLESGVNDLAFTDLEDSYQYQAALACHANVLLTINVKDFKNVAQRPLQIMTPTEFVERYL